MNPYEAVVSTSRLNPKPQWRRMLRYLRPYRARLLVAIVAKLIASGMFLLLPWVIENILDEVLTNGDLAAINRITAGMVGVFVVLSVVSVIGNYLVNTIGERVVVDLRHELYTHLHTLSLGFFAVRRVGELISRLSSDVTVMRGVLTSDLIQILRQAMTMVGGVVMMVVLNWRLSLFTLLVVPVLAVLSAGVNRFSRRGSTRVQDEIAGATIVAEEALQNVRAVKSYAREDYEINRYDAAVQRAFRAAVQLIRVRSIVGPTVDFLFSATVALILWYGGREVVAGRLTGGELIGFLMYVGVVGQAFSMLSVIYTRLQETVGATQRIFELLDTQPDLHDAPDARPLGRIEGRITFEGVSFAYTDEPDHKVLSDINLEIAPGEIIALVGPSGSGKSTLFNLIPRFYDVTEGVLRVDGQDVRTVTLASLRTQIGLVPQETMLFGGTIRENILYGRLDAGPDEVIAAARTANAHDFISTLPDGYETIVGERGVRLSGGQRQRIAIARAVLKDPRILLLDEATSALDNESERLVQDALERLMQDRTTVIIAHRLSTIRAAHRIAVLDAGRIVEIGSHEELLALNGLYARLHAMQFREADLLTR